MRTTGGSGRWLIIVPPLLFLLVFFLGPFAFAFTRDHHLQLAISLGNYRYLLTDEVYGVAYLYSLRTAFFSTLICLLLGYPMAYAIARAPKSAQGLLLL